MKTWIPLRWKFSEESLVFHVFIRYRHGLMLKTKGASPKNKIVGGFGVAIQTGSGLQGRGDDTNS